MKSSLVKSLAIASAFYFGSSAFAANLEPYTETALSQAEQSKGPVVLAFHSSSCGTCKQQKPVLDTLLKEADLSTISAFRVDFDEEKALRKKYRVNSPSTIIVILNNQEIARSVGETDNEALRRLLQKGLKS